MRACASGLYFLLVAVLFAGCGKESSPATGGSTASAPSAFTISALTAERSGDHLHLTVTVTVKNPGPAPLILAPPATQLWIGKDMTAAPFIGPGLEPAAIAPGTESEAATHWWLSSANLSGTLELEISGIREPVKSAGPFVLESLPDSQTTALAWPEWRPKP